MTEVGSGESKTALQDLWSHAKTWQVSSHLPNLPVPIIGWLVFRVRQFDAPVVLKEGSTVSPRIHHVIGTAWAILLPVESRFVP